MIRITIGWLWLCAVYASAAEPVKVDLLGDPLPPGAICRIGSSRTHENELTTVAMTPDASRIASCGQGESSIHVREPRTMREVVKIPTPAGEQIIRLAISEDGRCVGALLVSPPLDDRFCPVGSSPYRWSVKVWEVGGSRPLCQCELDRAGPVFGDIAFVGGRRKLVVGRGRLQVIDILASKVERSVGDAKSAIDGVHPIGRSGLVVARTERENGVIDTSDGRAVPVEWPDLPAEARTSVPKFSAGGGFVVFSTAEAAIRCRVELPTAARNTVRISDPVAVPQKDSMHVLALEESGRRCLCTHSEGYLLVDFVESARSSIGSLKHNGILHGAFAGKDVLVLFQRNRLLAGYRSAGLFDTDRKVDLLERAGVRFLNGGVRWSDDGRTVVSTPHLWDASTGRQLEEKPPAPRRPWSEKEGEDWLRGSRSFDGKRTLVFRTPIDRPISSGFDTSDDPSPAPINGIELRDTASGAVLRKFRGPGPLPTYITPQGMSRDGRIYVSDDRYHREVWHTPSGRKIAVLPPLWWKDTSEAPVARITPDGRRFLYRSREGLAAFDTRAGTMGETVPLPADTWPTVRGYDLSPDGRWAAIVDAKCELRFFDLHRADAAEVFATGMTNPALVRFSPDSTRVLVFSRGGFAHVWSVPSTPSPFTDLPPDGFGKAWDALKDPSAKAANESLERFARGGDAAVRFLADRVRPAEPFPPKKLKTLLTELGSVEYRRREAAEARLRLIADDVLAELDAALATEKDPEVRTRIARAIDRPGKYDPPSGEALRQMRAVEILERIGTPEAWKCVETLAKGAASSRVTEEAVSALARRK